MSVGMSTPTTTTPTLDSLTDKTRELCQFLLDDPDFGAAQRSIEAFEKDEEAQSLYEDWQRKAGELHQARHEGRELEESEIEELNGLLQQLSDHPVGSDFLEAEESINQIFKTVVKMVQKTLQNGRIPSAEEMSECCNSGGCGCSH